MITSLLAFSDRSIQYYAVTSFACGMRKFLSLDRYATKLLSKCMGLLGYEWLNMLVDGRRELRQKYRPRKNMGIKTGRLGACLVVL